MANSEDQGASSWDKPTEWPREKGIGYFTNHAWGFIGEKTKS